MPKKSIVFNYANSALRHALVNYGSRYLNTYVVTEYPKSGGSWVSQMLSEVLELPFRRNEFPAVGSQVLHGHYVNVSEKNNVLVVLRDGRDVMVSYYFHCLYENEHYNARLVQRTKRTLNIKDTEDVERYLPLFIEYLFEGKLWPKFTWASFTASWLSKEVAFIKYEDLLTKPADALQDSIYCLTGKNYDIAHLNDIADKYSFKNIAKRESGIENHKSFLRKGISGDWETKFNSDARAIFDHYAGEALVSSKYESDNQWVTK